MHWDCASKTCVFFFEQKYGYPPLLLETFIDISHFMGTCFRAANWIPVGRTQGRGRQDREMKATKSVKDIYLYPLAKDCRQRLGLSKGSGLGPPALTDGVFGDLWAQQEFGTAELGDSRLTRRLVEIAAAKAENPGKPCPQIAAGGISTTLKFLDRAPGQNAASKLHDQPEPSAWQTWTCAMHALHCKFPIT